MLRQHSGHVILLSASLNHPYTDTSSQNDINITFLLQQINRENRFDFHIDRKAKSCHTPRRNARMTIASELGFESTAHLLDIEPALSYFQQFYNWASSVSSYFTSRIFTISRKPDLDLSKINTSNLFNPVCQAFLQH